MNSELVRGVTLGLWVLSGLAFLGSVLLPGSTGAQLLGPVLIGMAVVLTALVPRRVSPVVGHAARWLYRSMIVFGTVLAFAITLVIVREGDQRSWLFVGYTAAAAIFFGFQGTKNGSVSSLWFYRIHHGP